MCSIEEAWAGQTFDGYKVQSQADLHRKYMPIGDDLLTRNNDFSVVKKEPAPRTGNNGINTKMVRPLHAPQQSASNSMNIAFADNQMPMDGYMGIEPRPAYMSIYDNAAPILPMPTQTQATAPTQMGRSAFSDINQAFQVSPVVERFMARGGDSNPLLNENSNDNRLVLSKKFDSADDYSQNKANNNSSQQVVMATQGLAQMQASLHDILMRLDRVERELHHGQNRNMCDMVLYVLVGMLIVFIMYSVLRK